MTAAERLVQLAGTTGTAAALLLAIGVGATTGEALNAYSSIDTGTAAEHILSEAVQHGWDTRQGIARNKTTLVKFEKISDVEHVCASSGAASGVRQPATWASASTKPLQEGANCGYKVFQTVSANAFVKPRGSGVLAGVRVLEPCADGGGACIAVGAVSGSVRPVCSGDAESRRARSMQGIGGGKPIVRAYGVQNPSDEQMATLAYVLTRKPKPITLRV